MLVHTSSYYAVSLVTITLFTCTTTNRMLKLTKPYQSNTKRFTFNASFHAPRNLRSLHLNRTRASRQRSSSLIVATTACPLVAEQQCRDVALTF